MDAQVQNDLVAANRDIRRFRRILESIAINVWVTNPEAYSASIIAGQDNLFGNLDSTVEKRLSAIHPDDVGKLRSEIVKSLSTLCPLDTVVRTKGADNGWQNLSLHALPLFADDGRIEEWVGVSTDVTRRETAEFELRRQQEFLIASQERLTIALDASEMGVYECNYLDGTIHCTPEVERILGVSMDTFQADSFLEHVHPDDYARVQREKSHSIQNRKTMRCEFRIVHPDGSVRWLTIIGEPYFDSNGQIIRMVGAVQDITERRSASDWLRSKNKVLKQIASGVSLDDVLCAIVEMLEAGMGDSKGSLMLIDEDLKLVLAAGPHLHDEYVKAINGVKIGEKVGSCGTAVYLKEAVISVDIESDPRWSNYKDLAKRFELGSCWSFPIFAPLNATSSSIEFPSAEIKGAEGKVLGALAVYRQKPSSPSEVDLKRINQAVQLASIAIEKHRNLESVRASEHRFRELANAMPQLVWTSDRFGNCNYGNRRLVETIGEKNMLDWQLAIHPEDRSDAEEKFLTAMRTGEPYTTEHRLFQQTTGEYRWYLARATASKDSSGNIDCWYGAATDIDNLKRTEQALREERDRLTAIASASPCALFSYVAYPDGQCCFPYASPAIKEIFGVMPFEVVTDARLALNRIDPQDLVTTLELLQKSAEQHSSLQSSFRVHHPEKGLIWIECLASPRIGPDNLVSLHGTFTDITQRKLIDARLLQSEKMEAMGRLAGGIAHDFNNLLTVVIGSCYLLENQLQGQLSELSNVKAIRHSSQRAANLTKQLLAFSRQQEIVPQVVDLNALVSNSELILRRLIGKDIELEIKLANDLQMAFADPTQIEQVLINLVINSRDAISTNGRITIATRNTQRLASENSARKEGLQPNALKADKAPSRMVEIEVSDSGHGISAEIQKRMFDPFFTTKTLGKGTGLGLAVVHGIVTQNGGAIEVDSQVGQGTSFRILLPPSRAIQDAKEKEGDVELLNGGNEKILIVDDDPEVADLAATFLKSLGYQVLIASSGSEAIKIFGEERDKIDALVTDVFMPGFTGGQLAAELLAMEPRLPILFMSGSEQIALDEYKLTRSDFPLLAKPFTPAELVRLLRIELELARSEVT